MTRTRTRTHTHIGVHLHIDRRLVTTDSGANLTGPLSCAEISAIERLDGSVQTAKHSAMRHDDMDDRHVLE
jgi:hypothetical protein